MVLLGIALARGSSTASRLENRDRQPRRPESRDGEYTVVTSGRSVLGAAAKALDRFNSDWWKGPRPKPDTVLRVALVASRVPYKVDVDRVLRWKREQAA